jgi:hypothetical protein
MQHVIPAKWWVCTLGCAGSTFLALPKRSAVRDDKCMTPAISTRVNKIVFMKNKIMNDHMTVADVFLTSDSSVIIE